MQHLITLADWPADEVQHILTVARDLRQQWRGGGNQRLLGGKILGMLFQKPSLRTRVSFECGMQHLGGTAMYLSPQEVQLGQRETVPDVARVLSRFVDGIMARVFAHRDVEELARYSRVPVINGLSDKYHPCQALADYLTISDRYGHLEGINLLFVGDGNNVAHSLLVGGAKLGVNVTVACPPGYEPAADVMALARGFAASSGASVRVVSDPREAVADADVVYTDVWASMGQEDDAEQRRTAFAGFQVNAELVRRARPGAIVMHDLPAHRGEEITDEVMDGPRSVVFDQAENRMHAQKAVLALLLQQRT